MVRLGLTCTLYGKGNLQNSATRALMSYCSQPLVLPEFLSLILWERGGICQANARQIDTLINVTIIKKYRY